MSDKQYIVLLDKMAECVRSTERSALCHYHALGKLFSTFLENGKRYGNRTAEKLAEDLQTRGIIGATVDARRLLYWAKNISDRYPDVATLGSMVEHGFTLTHAKLLLVLDEAAVKTIETQLVSETGEWVSTRELESIIGKARFTAAKEKVDQLVEPPAQPTWIDVDTGVTESSPTASTKPVSNAPVVKDTPKEKAPARAKTTPTVKDRVVRSPLKLIERSRSQAVKMQEQLGELSVMIRETAQIGFDSDKANRKYLTELSGLRHDLKVLAESAEAVISAIAGEQESND